MTILLDEEKVVKIVKFDFLVKIKLLLEMAEDSDKDKRSFICVQTCVKY
jgi:hypothetical protein